MAEIWKVHCLEEKTFFCLRAIIKRLKENSDIKLTLYYNTVPNAGLLRIVKAIGGTSLALGGTVIFFLNRESQNCKTSLFSRNCNRTSVTEVFT
jgi:hypothetical protein